MSTQASPDPEPSFFRAWSLRPKARRARSSDTTEISPRATPTNFKVNHKVNGPEHVRLKSEHLLDKIRLRDRSDESRTASEEAVALKLVGPVPAAPELAALSRDLMSVAAAEGRKKRPPPLAKRSLIESAPTTPTQKSGLFQRTKLRLGVNTKQSSAKRPRLDSPPSRSYTGQMLDRATSILKHMPEDRLTPTSSQNSNRSTTGSSAPHSYLSPLRGIHSNSSSLRNMLMGDGPLGTPTTPDPRGMYISSDQKQYFRVEISAPGAPTYLPSEARRIGTPPLLEQNGKPRGFFFSYDAPHNETNTVNSGKEERPRLRRKRSSDMDWYTAKLKADEARDNAMSFELNVPEHLPSSPLCPRHPKHKSGGKGICVYHGRNREAA